MDERQQRQINLIIGRELDLAARSSKARADTIYADHGFRKILGSGATIKMVVASCSEVAEELLGTLIDKVSEVSKCPDAIDRIVAALNDHFAVVEIEAARAGRMGSRGMAHNPPQSVLEAIARLVDQLKADIGTKIEIERFAFEPDGEAHTAFAPIKVGTGNKGGKPLAAHWDEMWADVAVQLYLGDLQPATQADIKRAMFDWFNARSMEISDTAVTDRARKLWLALEAAK